MKFSKLLSIIDEIDKYILRIVNRPIDYRINSLSLFLVYFMYLVYFLNFYFLFISKKKKLLRKYMLSSIFGLLFVYFLKYLINRPRPYFRPLLEKVDPSFPSSHSFFSAILFHVSREEGMPSYLRILSFTFSLLVPLLMIYIGVHYPSDVIAGFLLGYIFPFFEKIGNQLIKVRKKENVRRVRKLK